jgi:hypothetical protein
MPANSFQQIQQQEHTTALTYEEKMSWHMRWVVVIAFIIIFLCSLAVIAVTNNPLLVSLPGSLLFFMRPIMRYLFLANSNAQHREPSER